MEMAFDRKENNIFSQVKQHVNLLHQNKLPTGHRCHDCVLYNLYMQKNNISAQMMSYI